MSAGYVVRETLNDPGTGRRERQRRVWQQSRRGERRDVQSATPTIHPHPPIFVCPGRVRDAASSRSEPERRRVKAVEVGGRMRSIGVSHHSVRRVVAS
uniref:Uncharacterized protein n=1 Tax=Plectus sambesii TaxID=2011161 RepID=A0A914VIQ2_9BILA